MPQKQTLADLLATAHRLRSERGLRFNTVVCKPEHVSLLADGRGETLRMIFAEHGLRLQVDAMSPWPSLTVLWIDPAPAEPGIGRQEPG